MDFYLGSSSRPFPHGQISWMLTSFKQALRYLMLSIFFTQVTIEAGHLYHAVLQYAYALNRTLARNLEPNGKNIINALKKYTFDSMYSLKGSKPGA